MFKNNKYIHEQNQYSQTVILAKRSIFATMMEGLLMIIRSQQKWTLLLFVQVKIHVYLAISLSQLLIVTGIILYLYTDCVRKKPYNGICILIHCIHFKGN